MLMTLIISILLYLFGLDPATGRLKIYAPSDKFKQDVIDYRRLSRDRGKHARHMERKVNRDLKEHEPEYDAHYNHRDKGRHHDFARGSDGDREDDWRTSNAGIHNDHIDELPHWQKKILKKEYGADWKKKYEEHEKLMFHHETCSSSTIFQSAHKEPFLKSSSANVEVHLYDHYGSLHWMCANHLRDHHHFPEQSRDVALYHDGYNARHIQAHALSNPY